MRHIEAIKCLKLGGFLLTSQISTKFMLVFMLKLMLSFITIIIKLVII